MLEGWMEGVGVRVLMYGRINADVTRSRWRLFSGATLSRWIWSVRLSCRDLLSCTLP